MFELRKATAATLASVTNRSERHGEDEVPGVSIGIKIVAPNTILDSVSPTLRPTLYTTPPGQPEPLPGIEPATPLLRTEGIEYVAGSGVLEGWTVTVKHGIEDERDVILKACKIDKFRVFPKQGGEVELLFRVGTSAVDARILGLLGVKLNQEITLLIQGPKPGLTIDGSVGHEGVATMKKQKAAEAAGQKRLDDPEPKNGDDDGEGSVPDANALAEQRRADPNWPFKKNEQDAGPDARDATDAFVAAQTEPTGRGRRRGVGPH